MRFFRPVSIGLLVALTLLGGYPPSHAGAAPAGGVSSAGASADSNQAWSTVALLEQAPSEQAARCEVSQWQVAWGVKESFRAYLSGTLAGGEWITAGDVGYDTPSFTIDGNEGFVGADRGSGELVAHGSLRFVGHDGLLDQTLSTPRLRFGHDSLHLVFDVQGDTQQGKSVDQAGVEFVAVDASDATVDSAQGTWQVVGAPTVLTEAGAAAFGTYPAGEAFDPIDITISSEPGCLNPPGNAVFLGIALGSLVAVNLANI